MQMWKSMDKWLFQSLLKTMDPFFAQELGLVFIPNKHPEISYRQRCKMNSVVLNVEFVNVFV